jgi:hypothetical protein
MTSLVLQWAFGSSHADVSRLYLEGPTTCVATVPSNWIVLTLATDGCVTYEDTYDIASSLGQAD